MPPTAEITYTDVAGSVIRKTHPAAEDDEGIPFVPETVESVCLYVIKYFYFFVSYTFVY